MMLRTRAVATSLALAIPAAALVTYTIDRLRYRDQVLALERVVRSQANEQVRERCEADPNWFFTGPLEGRPRKGEIPVDPNDPNALPPRPKTTDQPFELFAYDEQFGGTSTAAPRFPNDFRRDLQRRVDVVMAPFPTPAGTGVQMAVPTGVTSGPCMYFLGRLRPPPGLTRTRITMFAGLFVLFSSAVWLALLPIVMRIRRLANEAQTSVREGYATIAPDSLKDELSSFSFVYNDAATVLRQRKARIDDQDDALKRFVTQTLELVSKPMTDVQYALAALAARSTDAAEQARLQPIVLAAHEASARLENLATAARLRMVGEQARTPVDLGSLIQRVVARAAPLASTVGVTIETSLPADTISIDANDAYIERAVANLVDNAIRYNRSGGRVTVSLERVPGRRGFSLRITDNGRGVTDDEMRGLTAVRRFRGDEAQNRRAGAPGLGLAVAREAADRSGLVLDLSRPREGGFAAELSVRQEDQGVGGR